MDNLDFWFDFISVIVLVVFGGLYVIIRYADSQRKKAKRMKEAYSDEEKNPIGDEPCKPGTYWICRCGARNTEFICMECGCKRPSDTVIFYAPNYKKPKKKKVYYDEEYEEEYSETVSYEKSLETETQKEIPNETANDSIEDTVPDEKVVGEFSGWNYTGAYDSEGYDVDGFNTFGFDREGYDREGFDRYGFDRDGFDHNGYDKRGYNREGYDQYGYDKDGYDKNGKDSFGLMKNQ